MKAILFDLDNTLLDRDTSLNHFIRKQYSQFATHFGHIPEEQYCQRFIELDAQGMVWKDRVYQSMVEEFNVDGIAWETLLEDYVNHFAHCCIAYDGVEAVLAQLRQAGCKMGIISNGKSPFQEKNIEALGIVEYFETILISEKEGVKKPSPAIFHKALYALEVAAHEAVYIGDNPDLDMKGAKDAGMRTIWKKNDRENDCPWADAVFDDFAELPMLITELK